MTEDDALSPEDRQAYITRYGEYRRVPIAHYGPFRLDREWVRHFTLGERELSLRNLVFEIDASSEFDMIGTTTSFYKMRGGPTADWTLPSRSQIIQLVTEWLRIYRPRPDGGIISLACYRRRVGCTDDGEAIPGNWYIPPLFRRPSNPMIDMEEATPFVEAALGELEQAEAGAQEPGHGQEL